MAQPTKYGVSLGQVHVESCESRHPLDFGRESLLSHVGPTPVALLALAVQRVVRCSNSMRDPSHWPMA